ncbi:MAG: VCBS repeat-containing protein [Sedimentisphaerales bacterium]|nr:VCBS repeat-containing protein [Sedimentisphaerales bacterium]
MEGAWNRHVIDDISKGADGVRLADIDENGHMDMVTGWEEGGITRLYLHPGPGKVRAPWPAVTVGMTPSVEDAVFVDLDKDGSMDVVTCCEGNTKTMFVHWGPADRRQWLNSFAWRQQPLGRIEGKMAYMYCLPMQVDGQRGTDLVVGAKGQGAQIGWLESPEDPRDVDQYQWHPVCPAGWIMSLITTDMDGDGDEDIVTTDRKGHLRGCRWLDNPGRGPSQSQPWKNHFIGGQDWEVMFMRLADLDWDGFSDAVVAARTPDKQRILWFRRLDKTGLRWTEQEIIFPTGTGNAKAPAVGDIDRDGRMDVVFSCEGADGVRRGVMWLSYEKEPAENEWTAHDISGSEGIKFDRLELLDLDDDGDLDVLTCEESEPDSQGKRKGLGVFWYENPLQ